MRPALIAASLAFLSLPGLAVAQQRPHPETANMCRASCNEAGNAQLGANRARTAQACAIRCDATLAYLSTQSHRGTAEATGRGRAPGSEPAAPRRATPPVPQRMTQPVAYRTAAPAPRPVPATPAAARPAASHGVIYGARTPSAGFGLVVGQADRMAAHRIAQQACTAGGPDCRPLAEFTEACGAAAHGVKRSQWALFMTSDPNSYVVTSLSAGSGATQAHAEQQAIAECRSRDPMAVCRISASACRS
ncbi:DUF4189 domain-containing protein [Roseomonas sp. F4]